MKLYTIYLINCFCLMHGHALTNASINYSVYLEFICCLISKLGTLKVNQDEGK